VLVAVLEDWAVLFNFFAMVTPECPGFTAGRSTFTVQSGVSAAFDNAV
jgi:hypothetical protein